MSNALRCYIRSVVTYPGATLSSNMTKAMRGHYISLRILFVATFALLSSCAAFSSQELEGVYYLEDSQPLNAQLLLRKDGTFIAEVAVAGVGVKDRVEGVWEVEGNTLTLKDPPSAQAASKLVFEARYERTHAQLEKILQYNNKDGYDLARKNYVLDLMYAKYSRQPDIQPLYVYFQFSHGTTKKQLFSPKSSTDILLPYDPKNTLKKIGFSSASSSEATQWIDILPTSRMVLVGLTKTNKEAISFKVIDETDLAEAQSYTNDEDVLKLRQNNYEITLFYDNSMAPPPIKPVDIFWQFQDGSVQQQIWADSNQSRLALPYIGTKTLKRVGMRVREEVSDIQWFDISPSGRLLYFSWKVISDYPPDGLATGFHDMQMTIEPECLKLYEDDSHVCFRRK